MHASLENRSTENGGSTVTLPTAAMKGRKLAGPPGMPMMMMTTTTMPPSAANPATFSGGYHPEFMFCGSCTTCQPSTEEKKMTRNSETLNDYIGGIARSGSTDSEDLASASHQTTLGIVTALTEATNHTMFLESLLQPLAGVVTVHVDVEKAQVSVNHTLQTTPAQLMAALKRGGYETALLESADRPSSSREAEIVRSQFHVSGICCAMEIPAVRKIVRPLRGVEGLQINITTKMVYVQHDTHQMSTDIIADCLTREGFPATIVVDGGVQWQQQKQQQQVEATRAGRTTLHVQGRVLHDQDVVPLQQQLSQLPGVEHVLVNVNESVVIVDHDIGLCKSDDIVIPGYNLSVVKRAEDKLQADSLFQLQTKSKYVESTLAITHLQHRHVPLLQSVLKQNYIRAQVRAFFPNIPSQTIKVEHDPELLPIQDVPKLLGAHGLEAHVAVDGKEAGLILPLLDDYGSGLDSKTAIVDQEEGTSLRMHVVLSGIFWVLSMMSPIGGLFTYFEYFGLLSVFFGLPPVARKALRTVRRRQFDSNCMMVTAALGALLLQEFDEAASVAFLFSVSEYLEALSTTKARKALEAIVQLRPEHAAVIHPVTKEIVIVPAVQVPIGSLLSVRTGDKIAADGIVVEGMSAVDESSLTGESKPVMKRADDPVSGGSINVGTTQLVVKTTSSIDDSVVSRMIRLIESAQSSRSVTEKMIDQFARSYTPLVVCVAAAMCTIPWLFGSETGRYWTLNGLIIIVIACPCSLTISTPVTYAAGLAATAQRGIIVKGGAYLEALGRVNTVVLDKTGTITHGQFHVKHLETVGSARAREEMLELLALMEAPSSHPLSETLVRATKKEGISIRKDADVTLHTILKGEGVTAKVNEEQVYVGNTRLFERIRMYEHLPSSFRETVTEWANDGGTVGFIGIDGVGIIGAFSMTDTIREEAYSVIQTLHMRDINVVMLTGDGDGAAQAVARQVGIPSESVHSQLLPEDKMHFVGSLKRPTPRGFVFGREKSKVLFCGDGESLSFIRKEGAIGLQRIHLVSHFPISLYLATFYEQVSMILPHLPLLTLAYPWERVLQRWPWR